MNTQPSSTRLAAQYLSTHEAAESLGYTIQHTRLLIRQGKLAAERLGRDWMVLREAVTSYQTLLQFEEREETPPPREPLGVVNVASVPMRSPFRYPGGKTWLVPRIRQWLRSRSGSATELLEPFAGGGIVSLTTVFEDLASSATLVELDEDLAAVWETILSSDAEWLCERIMTFTMTRPNVAKALDHAERSRKHRAFATLLRNRINRGGILAPGAGVVKNGENGKGLSSRWYPATLRRRIRDIAAARDRLKFVRGDGLSMLESWRNRARAVFFVDPPYTVAGRRLYTHSEIEHRRLFDIAATLKGDFLMTYDDAPEIEALARAHGFEVRRVPMKNTHHERKFELLIGRNLGWFH